MNATIRDVRPAELPDAVEPGELTLVLGGPAVGKSHYTRGLGSVVTHLSAAAAVADDDLVIVDDFAAAVLDVGATGWSMHGAAAGAEPRDAAAGRSLLERPGGAVLVTRPRSLDWLCQRGVVDAEALLDAADAVLVVRTPPADAPDHIERVRSVVANGGVQPLADEARQQVLDRCTFPGYDFANATLRRRVGRYEATVTPAAFLSLSSDGDDAVLVAAAVRRALADADVSVGPLLEISEEDAAALVPRGGLDSRRPSDDSPALRTAVALVALAVATDADWLDPFVESRLFAGAAETLEIALDVPPGTIELVRLFAADAPRARIRERLADTDSPLTMADVDRDTVGDAMDTVAAALDTAAWPPEDYRAFPLVGAWHSASTDELHEAAAARALPDSTAGGDESAVLNGPSRARLDTDALVGALDGHLVVLTGPSGSGKRRLAASAATTLEAWGATVVLPDLRQPAHVETFVDATPNAVVVATYGGEPARIVSDAGVRALVDWVADGVCAGALVICDESWREQFETICERAGCADRGAWHDRVEFSLAPTGGDTDPDPATVARDLLDAADWPATSHPSRLTLDVESVTDRSTLAVIAGVPDAALDAPLLGHVLAETVAIVGGTHRPEAADAVLSLVDDLLADVARNRCDTDGAVTFRGVVYGTAMAAVATADPTTDEWVAAIADRAIDLTNETAAPHGQDSVGGEAEPVVSAFGIALATLARPADGTGPKHGALACVDQVLDSTADADAVAELPGSTLRSRIYGELTERIVADADPAAAERALEPVAGLVQQAAATSDDTLAAFVMGNSFAAAFGAVAGAAASPDDLSAWVDALGDLVRDSLAFVPRQPDRAELVRNAYSGAIGYWAFAVDCPPDRLDPWLGALGADCSRTVTAVDLDDPRTFVVELYGQAVWHVVGSRDYGRAKPVFEACPEFVDSIAASGLAAEGEWTVRAALHAEALAAFAIIEHPGPDGTRASEYDTGALSFPGSTDFEDWIELYDGVVRAVALDEGPQRARERFLTALYRGALSTHLYGFDGESESGISPRQEHTWLGVLTDCIETTAGTADLVADPVAFLGDVYGDAAVRWAAEGGPTRAGEWLDSLVDSFRACRRDLDGPTKTAWFDAFAAVDAAILQTVLTRPGVGERTHDRLVEAAITRIEAAATADDHPAHPVVYAQSAFGTALALAVEADPEEVRFGVTEVVAAVEERVDFAWVALDRAAILERIYATALAVVGRDHGGHENVEAWLEAVTDRIEATATRELPADPAAFVAGVYTRAYVAAVEDGADAWRQRLDSELRAFTAGSHVDDSVAFLEGLYADVVVAGTTRGQSAAAVEACVSAVYQSIEAASEARLARTDEPAVRTLSRAAAAIEAATDPRADHVYTLGQALRAVGGEALEAAVFDAGRDTDT